MADIFTKKKRSEIMSKIRAFNTRPELIVRKFLFSQGFRYRIHQKSLPGTPDIVLKKYKTVILINGCFWHGHRNKNCKIFKIPKSRQSYWIPKIENNRCKDIQQQKSLKKLGWKVIVIWECQLKKRRLDRTLESVVNKILACHPFVDHQG